MCWQYAIPALIGAAGSIFGAKEQSGAISDAADATLQATLRQLGFARESRDIALMLSDPQRQAGYSAMAAMMDMMGLPRTGYGGAPPGYAGYTPDPYATNPYGGTATAETRYSPDNPFAEGANRELGGGLSSSYSTVGARAKADEWEREHGNAGNFPEGYAPYGAQTLLPPGVTAPDLGAYPQYDWQADPSYDWRYKEGIRAMDTSAAARGFDLSGGYGRKLTKYGQDMASQEYMNIYNRLANLAGFGQVGVATGAQAAGQYGQLASQAMGGYGATRASAYVAQGNTMAGMYSDLGSLLSGLPWGDWFGGSDSNSTAPGYGNPSRPPGV